MRVDWAKPQPVSVGGAQQQAGVDGVQVRVDGVQRRKKKRRCRRRSKEKGRWTWLRGLGGGVDGAQQPLGGVGAQQQVREDCA